ncbi:F-box/LRR-repeat protein 6 isoform X2 [Eublepharis macularius]|uniref:F-box/LRR-repeat protein 6 isoform X2 n=1 Tax=Eublepharis macularius TaxID=481883 RepID=A0AA97L5D4_EUBMA|nr:F-box/LRR-repeat protein 6 isoform X2 [Eublepharis macularius]
MEEKPPGTGMPPAVRERRAPRKRRAEASGSPGPAGQAPKKKARRVPRRSAPHFLVHETDNDMLLIISNVGEEQERPARKVCKRKRKKPRQQKGLKKPAGSRGKNRALAAQPVAVGDLREGSKGSPASTPPAPGSSWGEQLPVEILVQIFQHVVALEGSVPFLCRMARVCRLWYGAAASPVLWQKVSLGYCWAAPGQKWSHVIEKRVLGTVEWLAAHRFSRLQDFALCHWKNHVPFVLKVHSSAVVSILEAAGSRIRHLWLTYSSQTSAVMAALSSGCCPGLRLLEMNMEIKKSSEHFQFPVEKLQAACPHLQVLRLLNVVWSPKPSCRSALGSPGFPELAELCLATTSYSFVDDNTLQRILWASGQLRMLDLRGCFRVTPKALQLLPCPDLEQLYLGLYCSASHIRLPLEGSPLITRKWSRSLRELDLAGQSFSESDLQQAMAAFAREESQSGGPVLRSLNLTGTKVVLSTVSTLITSCPALIYLNLSSCRHLPRGTKKAYRGREEIHQCLQHLLRASEEPL